MKSIPASAANYFDAWTVVGPRPHKQPGSRWSLEHLLEEMEHCAISGAMVLSAQSVHYDPALGNLRLARELAGQTRLHPIWNVMPDASGEFPSPKELVASMREHQVRATAIHPLANAWDPFDPSSFSLFSKLSDEAIPVWIRREEISGYETLRRLLTQWPDLPIVFTGAHWGEQRLVLPLLKAHSNLHVTLENFQIHYGVEDLSGMGLEKQLLFGSNAPSMSMGAHRCYIDYADVPSETRSCIAGENLCRLLKFEMPPAAEPPRNDDCLMQAARAGTPLPIPVIDMHMHVLDEGLNGGGGKYRMSRGGPAGTVALLKRLGCNSGGFMSWNGTVGGDILAGNLCTKNALDQLPPSFWGLGSIDPAHFSQEELKKIVPELYSDPRFIGMKPYTVHDIPYDDPSYDVFWSYGEKHRLYALIHRIRRDYSEVTNLARKYPNVQWVVAHCAGSFDVAALAVDAVRQYPNIYAEITLTSVCLGTIEYLVEGCGADRVLYGSDTPMRDPRQQLGWVLYSRLPLEAKRKVLSENALALLSRIPRRSQQL